MSCIGECGRQDQRHKLEKKVLKFVQNYSKRVDNIGDRMWTVKHFELKSFSSLQNYSRCRQDWCCRDTSDISFCFFI
ncbi:unnamed protein product [Lathyrus sativus]|nr:unnamed protein product [Lathyrus sativus]